MMKKLLFAALVVAQGFMLAAAQEVDRTSYIANPSFESGFSGWTQSGLQTQTNNDFPKKEGGTYVEKWVSQGTKVGNASVSQVVKGLPIGKYKLVAGAMNYNQGNTSQQCEGAWIFAGDVKTPIYTPDDYQLEFSTVSGEVELGFKAEGATGNWLATDNYRLYYTGPVEYAEIEAAVGEMIAQAQAISGNVLAQEQAALAAAVAACQQITSSTNTDDVQAAISALAVAIDNAIMSIAAYDSLQDVIAQAEKVIDKKMNAEIAAALTGAYYTAKGITTESTLAQVNAANQALAQATEAALSSIDNYAALADAIKATEDAVAGNAAAAAHMADLLAEALDMYTQAAAQAEEIADMISLLAKSLLSYNLDNATGPVPAVTTNPYVARGCRIAFGRLDVDNNGAEILEKGFCWSEDPEPTVLDERSSFYYTHAGEIYTMLDIKPATKYYVRAYAITKGYQVGYGEVVKVVTLPEATCTWSWERNDATDEEDARCRKACSEAISNYNYCSGFKGFHLSAHYVKGAGAGNGTADCSYGGWMRISQNVPYQRTGTVQHETNHGVGVGTTQRWSNCADLRADVTRGYWLGRRANELVNFFENTDGIMTVTGDGTHMWVVNKNGGTTGTLNYGINGAHEDSGYQLLYYANAMLTEYVCEDGLCPTYSYHNGMPCYTFDFEPGKKYYLVNENEERGLRQGGFFSAENDKFRWSYNTEVNDYQAWYIDYNYENGYYRFKNAATGKYLAHNNKALRYTDGEPAEGEEFQLLPSRVDLSLGNYKTYGYWLTWWSGSTNCAIRANEMDGAYGVYTGVTFAFGDKDSNQRFVIVSEDELEAFMEGAGVQSVIANPAEKTIVGIYGIDGKQQSEMRTGINIVRYSDGSAQKVVY